MPKDMLAFQVRELRDALLVIEAHLQSGESTKTALEDFKVAVDDVRTAIMAIVDATRETDFRRAISDFHAKRANELAQNVLSDVLLGTVDQSSAGWDRFHRIANESLEQLDFVTGRALDRLASMS